MAQTHVDIEQLKRASVELWSYSHNDISINRCTSIASASCIPGLPLKPGRIVLYPPRFSLKVNYETFRTL